MVIVTGVQPSSGTSPERARESKREDRVETKTDEPRQQKQVQLQVVPISKHLRGSITDNFDQAQMGQTQYLQNMDPVYPQQMSNKTEKKVAQADGPTSCGFYAITNKDLVTPGIESDISSKRNLASLPQSIDDGEHCSYRIATNANPIPRNHMSGRLNVASALSGHSQAKNEENEVKRGGFRPQKIQKSKKVFHERSYSTSLVSRFIKPSKKKDTNSGSGSTYPNRDINSQAPLNPFSDPAPMPAADSKLTSAQNTIVNIHATEDEKVEQGEDENALLCLSQLGLFTSQDPKGNNTASRYTIKFQACKDKTEDSQADYPGSECYKVMDQSQQSLRKSLSGGGTKTAEFKNGRLDPRVATAKEEGAKYRHKPIYPTVEIVRTMAGVEQEPEKIGEEVELAKLAKKKTGGFVTELEAPQIANNEQGVGGKMGLSPCGVETQNHQSRSGFHSDRQQNSHESVIRCIQENQQLFTDMEETNSPYQKIATGFQVPRFNRMKSIQENLTKLRRNKKPIQPNVSLRQKGHQVVQTELIKRALKLKARRTIDINPVDLGVMGNLQEESSNHNQSRLNQRKNEVTLEASVPKVSQNRVQRRLSERASTVDRELSKKNNNSMNGNLFSGDQISSEVNNSYQPRGEQIEVLDVFSLGRRARPRKREGEASCQHRRSGDGKPQQSNNLLLRSSQSAESNHNNQQQYHQLPPRNKSRTKSVANAHGLQRFASAFVDPSLNGSEKALISPEVYEPQMNTGDNTKNSEKAQSQKKHDGLNRTSITLESQQNEPKDKKEGKTAILPEKREQYNVTANNPAGASLRTVPATAHAYSRALSAAGMYKYNNKAASRGAPTDPATTAKRSTSPSAYDAHHKSSEGRVHGAIRKVWDKKVREEPRSQEKYLERHLTHQLKNKQQQPISIVNLELQAPQSHQSADQSAFPQQKRLSYPIHLNHILKEQRDNSNSRNKAIRNSQNEDGTFLDSLNTVPSSRRRHDPLNDSRDARNQCGLTDKFGRLYEQKRLAQIQNVCIDDVVEEVKLVTTSFDPPRSKQLNQSNSRPLEPKGEEASNAGQSRQRQQEPEGDNQGQEPENYNPQRQNLSQGRAMRQTMPLSPAKPSDSTQLAQQLEIKLYDLSRFNRMSTEAYQCKYTKQQKSLQNQLQRATIQPSSALAHPDRKVDDLVDSPEYKEMRQQDSMRIRSSREIRIHLSQEEHGHFDTITNPSHKNSSPKTKEYTPSRNMSPEVFEKLRCFNILEDDKLMKTPMHHLQDMETQLNKNQSSALSKEPLDRTSQDLHDDLQSRNHPAIPLGNTANSKGGDDKSNTTALLQHAAASRRQRQGGSPSSYSYMKVGRVDAGAANNNRDLKDGFIDDWDDEPLRKGAQKPQKSGATMKKSKTIEKKMTTIDDRLKSLNNLLEWKTRPVVALNPSRLGSPYIAKKQQQSQVQQQANGHGGLNVKERSEREKTEQIRQLQAAILQAHLQSSATSMKQHSLLNPDPLIPSLFHFFHRRAQNQTQLFTAHQHQRSQSGTLWMERETRVKEPVPIEDVRAIAEELRVIETPQNMAERKDRRIPGRNAVARGPKNNSLPQKFDHYLSHKIDSKYSSRDNSTLKDQTHESFDTRFQFKPFKIQQIIQNATDHDMIREQTFNQDEPTNLKTTVTFAPNAIQDEGKQVQKASNHPATSLSKVQSE